MWAIALVDLSVANVSLCVYLACIDDRAANERAQVDARNLKQYMEASKVGIVLSLRCIIGPIGI